MGFAGVLPGNAEEAVEKNGYGSSKFDILLDSRDDVVSSVGFYRLLDMSLARLDCAGNGKCLKFHEIPL